MIDVSIIIPFFNSEKTIGNSLSSILEIEIPNGMGVEIICVDDGSEDQSFETVERYLKRIKSKGFFTSIIRQENKGPAAARNRAIMEAQGDWISFLDADDKWLPERFIFLYPLLLQANFDLICHSEFVRDFGSDKFLRVNNYGLHFSFKELLTRGNCLSPSATIVKKSVLIEAGCFCEDLDKRGVEDYDLWLRLSSQGTSLLAMSDALGVYYRHDKNLSNRYDFYDRVNKLLLKHWKREKVGLSITIGVCLHIFRNFLKKYFKCIFGILR